ncbi:MAG: phosphoribosyltransferase family protein, partial [Waterburya sp.]
MNVVFPNRREAGQKLAKKLTDYANHPQAIVLGLPRGGVPVAYEIAKILNLPLDVCLVKKLGLP